MPILLITGPANAGKARAVFDELRRHHSRGRRPLLVVPTRADSERYSEELVSGGLAGEVRAVRFDGLIAEIVRRAGPVPRPLGALARERLLATLSGRASRGMTCALGAFVSELQVQRVSPVRLREALREWVAVDPAARTRARRLGTIYEEYERALSALDCSDPEQRATAALDVLRREPARWGEMPVLFYGFDDFTPLQLDAVETLGVIAGADVTVSLTFERGREAFAGRARTFQTLRPLASEHRELAPRAEYYERCSRRALHHLERQLFESSAPAPVDAQGAVRLLEGGGERAELELVAEEILALLARGVPAREIAVAHRAPATITELLEEVFAARGIPYTLHRRVRFADTALGGALLGALHSACEPEAELEQLLRWLRVSPQESTLRVADELEARARRAGVTTVADGRALWAAARWSGEPLQVLARLRDGAAAGVEVLVERTAEELERLVAGSQLKDASPREARALEAGRKALGELHELVCAPAARAIPGLLPDPAALIAILRGLELVVESPLASLGAPLVGSGEGVAVLDPLALRARRVRALFLCGLQEGVFPAPARAEPLLSEDERRRLVESSGLLALAGGAGADTLATERYLFYAAVSRPEELLALSWHVADDDGLPRSRSLFVDDVCDLFTCDLHGARGRRALGEVGEGGIGSVGPASRIAPLREERVLAQLGEQRMWSASALEAWAGCPVRWFVERFLAAQDLEPEPEPLARGALAHAALRDVLDGLRAETGSARLRPAILARARELLRAALTEREGEHPLSIVPERVPGVRRRLEADLERYLEHAATRDSPLEPTQLELSFGFADDPDGLPPLELGDGIRVRGRIDRVDIDPGGAGAVVYDYKGAHAPDGARWMRERSFQVPLYMRALESATGAHVAGGFYQPLSGRDLRARGALELDAGIELDCVRGDTYERAELLGLVREGVDAAREAAQQARAGELEARPTTCGFGESGCMYPEICRCES
ncbi:MAG TPA: PD-(D/E)XK nuclease family protein [Solirubrobacteraceae bacterium]|jgi:ATP-dependent helicase/DNAse subunit B